jgi:hypothetical protein
MVNPQQTLAEIEQEGRDAVASAERAEEVRETPLGEWIEEQGETDGFNPISGDMD